MKNSFPYVFLVQGLPHGDITFTLFWICQQSIFLKELTDSLHLLLFSDLRLIFKLLF